MTRTNQIDNEATILAIADWLSDPELIDWLQHIWQKTSIESEPKIKNALTHIQNQLSSDLGQNQIILVSIEQTIFLIGVDVKTFFLWTKQTERIGNAVLHTTPYWHKSAFEFYK
jgi:hypothetical protein